MDVFAFDGLPYPAMPPVARVALILAKYAFLGRDPARSSPRSKSRRSRPSRFPATRAPTSTTSGPWPRRPATSSCMEPGPAPATSFAYWGPEIRLGTPQPALTIDSGHRRQRRELSLHASTRTAPRSRSSSSRTQLTKAPIPIPIPGRSRSCRRSGASRRCRRRSPADRHRPAVADRGAGARLRLRGAAFQGRAGLGHLDVLRYGRLLQARALGRRARRRRRLRRASTTSSSVTQQPDARQLQAGVHAEAQRPPAHLRATVPA